ncbi:hypothetical protein [Kocuria sp. CPCC 205263]|uniref:hypothetical protein n=1 Tax=Kocuria sp. CPCC 205263 TaxID=3073555 RepID=UPI0034D68DDB
MAPALKTGVRLFVFATPAGVAVLAVVTDTAAVMLLVAVPGAVVGWGLYQDQRRASVAARATDGTAGHLSDPPGTRPLIIPCPEAPTMDDTTLGRSQARLLHHALGRSGITVHRLWMHYLSLGGIVGEMELEAYLYEIFHLPAVERDRLMHTANALLDPRSHPFLPCTGELLRRDRVHDQRGDHQS